VKWCNVCVELLCVCSEPVFLNILLMLPCLQVTLEYLHEIFHSAKHTMHWLRHACLPASQPHAGACTAL
jgi:hypothetical protein